MAEIKIIKPRRPKPSFGVVKSQSIPPPKYDIDGIERVTVPKNVKPVKEIIDNPRLVCLCPTFRKPLAVLNSYALFLKQTYQNKFLYIFDDGGNFIPYQDDNVCLEVSNKRMPSLYEKYRYMARRAIDEFKADGLVIWEDDDVYMPNHLELYSPGISYFDFVYPSRIYYNTGNNIYLFPVKSLFHASIAFRSELFNSGITWGETKAFDLVLIRSLMNNCSRYDPAIINRPTYVFRWNYYWNGERFMGVHDNQWYQIVEREIPPIEEVYQLEPKLDERAQKLIDFINNIDYVYSDISKEILIGVING